MRALPICCLFFCAVTSTALAVDRPVTIRFQAQVGDEAFACEREYEGVGVTKSKIKGRDFRFYVSDVRLLDATGKETPVNLDQDGKWQTDDLALLDFENGTGACSNGTPEMNAQITGKVPEGQYAGLSFTMGVPFNKNHIDPLAQPSPLNLTALFWVWNAGHKFARIEFASTGTPRGFFVHVGSTGCTPHETRVTIPTSCKAPNRVEVTFPSFDISRDAVIADLGALLQNTNVDASQNEAPLNATGGMSMGPGCMSGPDDADCAGVFLNLGLPFGDRPASEQKFFRIGKAAPDSATRAAR
jgi:uncharacterized repeat protein (TIGR04052 family)